MAHAMGYILPPYGLKNLSCFQILANTFGIRNLRHLCRTPVELRRDTLPLYFWYGRHNRSSLVSRRPPRACGLPSDHELAR
jgi:hypothetical protein